MTNVFVSAFSFSFTITDSFDDVDISFEELEDLIKSVPKYNNIKVTKDLLDYVINGDNLDDILYEISNYSDSEYGVYLSELERIISSFKSALYTDEVVGYAISGLSYLGDFVAYYDESNRWLNVPDKLKISNSQELFDLNYNNLGEFPIDNVSFSTRAQLMFYNIDFHPDFKDTLLTVKNGDFKAYSIEFVRALRALHDAMPKFTAKGHNPPDLAIIASESAILGRKMGCSFQGKNKKNLKYNFTIKGDDGVDYSLMDLNCEYHLKINYDNNGKRIAEKHKGLKMYNRAYFGLPLLAGKKRIALAFLGCHYDEK